jgi:hypothetical protein
MSEHESRARKEPVTLRLSKTSGDLARNGDSSRFLTLQKGQNRRGLRVFSRLTKRRPHFVPVIFEQVLFGTPKLMSERTMYWPRASLCVSPGRRY